MTKAKHGKVDVLRAKAKGYKKPKIPSSNQTEPRKTGLDLLELLTSPAYEHSKKGAFCQESSGISGPYIKGMNCLRPANFIVRNSDPQQYAMCWACADHNVKNRGGVLVKAGEQYELYRPSSKLPDREDMDTAPALGGEAAGSTGDQTDAPPAMPTKLPTGEDLLEYVRQGMAKFKPRLLADFETMLSVDRPASELARVYNRIRDIQEIINDVNKLVDQTEAKLAELTIPGAFAREKIKSFTTDDGWRVGTSIRLLASILKDNRADAHAWLRANGLPDLIQETVNSGTLSSTAKDLLANGRELPEGLFSVHYKTTTSRTKVQVKK